MSDGKTEADIQVIVSPTFKRAFKKLNTKLQDKVDDEIEALIENPELGEQKKGNLSHLRVHKFKLDRTQYLLGYNWQQQRLTLYLLQLGPHENYYQDAAKRSDTDKKFIS